MSTYYAILTAVGEAKLANATALGTKLQLSKMAVGDGNGALPSPVRTQTALVRETYRADLNNLSIDPVNASQIIAELVIPETEGGYWLRELGIYDAAGDLFAVANCPPSYKPQMAEGSGRTQVLRMVLIVSSTAAVQLKIDPSIVLATRAYVDTAKAAAIAAASELIVVHMEDEDPHPQYKTEVATEQEAEEGTNNVKRMTPLRVLQAIMARMVGASETVVGMLRVATQAEMEQGDSNALAVSPKSFAVETSRREQSVMLRTLGYSRTYLNFTSSRFSGVTYTNNRPFPIFVIVVIDTAGGVDTTVVRVGGLVIFSGDLGVSAMQAPVSFAVANGQEYSVTVTGGSIRSWVEMI